MEIKEKQKNDENILHKSGNFNEVFKSEKFSKINIDISRLSGKGFSNLLQKARNLQEIKTKNEKQYIENEESKSKENQKDKINDSFSLKIPNNLKMLKKFSLRMSNKKINKNMITSFDNQNSLKEENFFGITTTDNSNSLNNCNFATEKRNNDINESNNDKEKDSLESSSINNRNIEKRKYSNFYRIINNIRNKNENKNNIKQRNKKISIFNPDSLYKKKENIEYTEEGTNKRIDDKKNKKNNEEKDDEDNTDNNEQEKMNLYEYQFGNSHSSTEDILHDLDNIISLDNNSNNNSNNISNLKVLEENEYENNKNEDNNILNIEEFQKNIINFEDESNNIIKGIEYETVNSKYSIKKCSTVIEYSFREDQNISYCQVMEDKSKSIENFNNNKKQIIFELFDGFKGDEVSTFLQQNFTHIYKQYLEETNGNIPRSLVKTFHEIDEIIKKLPNINDKSSTGTVVHITWENKKKLMVYCGNVGNSKICLVSPKYVVKLSQEQATPESKNMSTKTIRKKYNKNNILKKRKYEDKNEEGKHYKVFGNYIVNESQEQEKEKERKIGSYKFNRYSNKINRKENNKNEESNDKSIKSILVPYIAKMEIDLNIKNQFLFLASNGIWNKIDENEMKELIDNTKDTEQLCSSIVKNALYRDTKDNISIFSIKLT